ncbi:MAG TPA: hypothetical protein VJ912_02520 [Candidatus Nanoarchaeia archaeon]|nr:hypothetical protein [Candidatus Nanoarchaeia archaeon]
MKGCGVLFKSNRGIFVCGEKKADGNIIYCPRCEEEEIQKKEEKTENVFNSIEQALPLVKKMLSNKNEKKR